MRIALRTSGGRGEYELAGRQGSIHASDIFDHELVYELTPSILIPGRAIATRVQGKPRIRLEDRETTTHLYRLLAGVLLLPKPKREFKETHGETLLAHEAYSVTAIKMDVGDRSGTRVVLRPTDLLLENADNLQSRIEFPQRMSRMTRIWEAAANKPGGLPSLLREHMAAVLATNADHKLIEKKAAAIAEALHTNGDPLPLAEDALGVREAAPDPPTTPQQPQFTHQADFGVEDDTPPVVARIERLRQWRQIAVRGSAGNRFRSDVAAVYDSRCVFSGRRLPRMDITDSAGIDAAHILPWSTHNINSVSNGICLDKLCHWAFDEGILRLKFDRSADAYFLEVPARVERASSAANFDLEYFRSLAGPVPRTRLPRDPSNWPSTTYLRELNAFMSADSSGS